MNGAQLTALFTVDTASLSLPLKAAFITARLLALAIWHLRNSIQRANGLKY